MMAAAMILGENIGTTITANIAAIPANVSAKRAAIAHLMFNVSARHHRHFPVGAADETPKPEFDNVQAYLVHLVVFVEQEGHLAVAFHARHGVNGHAAQILAGDACGFQFKVMRAVPTNGEAISRSAGWSSALRLFLPASNWFRKSQMASPECGQRRQEIIDFHHDFVDRVHLIQDQGEFRIVGDLAVAGQAVARAIDLLQDVSDRQMVALRRQATIDRAAHQGQSGMLQLARNSRSTCTFSALHTPPSIRPDVAGAAVLDVGERRAA